MHALLNYRVLLSHLSLLVVGQSEIIEFSQDCFCWVVSFDASFAVKADHVASCDVVLQFKGRNWAVLFYLGHLAIRKVQCKFHWSVCTVVKEVLRRGLSKLVQCITNIAIITYVNGNIWFLVFGFPHNLKLLLKSSRPYSDRQFGDGDSGIVVNGCDTRNTELLLSSGGYFSL